MVGKINKFVFDFLFFGVFDAQISNWPAPSHHRFALKFMADRINRQRRAINFRVAPNPMDVYHYRALTGKQFHFNCEIYKESANWFKTTPPPLEKTPESEEKQLADSSDPPNNRLFRETSGGKVGISFGSLRGKLIRDDSSSDNDSGGTVGMSFGSLRGSASRGGKIGRTFGSLRGNLIRDDSSSDNDSGGTVGSTFSGGLFANMLGGMVRGTLPQIPITQLPAGGRSRRVLCSVL